MASANIRDYSLLISVIINSLSLSLLAVTVTVGERDLHSLTMILPFSDYLLPNQPVSADTAVFSLCAWCSVRDLFQFRFLFAQVSNHYKHCAHWATVCCNSWSFTVCTVRWAQKKERIEIARQSWARWVYVYSDSNIYCKWRQSDLWTQYIYIYILWRRACTCIKTHTHTVICARGRAQEPASRKKSVQRKEQSHAMQLLHCCLPLTAITEVQFSIVSFTWTSVLLFCSHSRSLSLSLYLSRSLAIFISSFYTYISKILAVYRAIVMLILFPALALCVLLFKIFRTHKPHTFPLHPSVSIRIKWYHYWMYYMANYCEGSNSSRCA